MLTGRRGRQPPSRLSTRARALARRCLALAARRLSRGAVLAAGSRLSQASSVRRTARGACRGHRLARRLPLPPSRARYGPRGVRRRYLPVTGYADQKNKMRGAAAGASSVVGAATIMESLRAAGTSTGASSAVAKLTHTYSYLRGSSHGVSTAVASGSRYQVAFIWVKIAGEWRLAGSGDGTSGGASYDDHYTDGGTW
ncbi:MAG: hypothetical protein MZV70_03535 [Desulfobacterales bacterium]|nr:hypothetical protein [Desulfobacterales bacterium]